MKTIKSLQVQRTFDRVFKERKTLGQEVTTLTTSSQMLKVPFVILAWIRPFRKFPCELQIFTRTLQFAGLHLMTPSDEMHTSFI